MKKFIVFVVVVAIVNVLVWYVVGPLLFTNTAQAPTTEGVRPEVIDVFIYTLQEEVNKKIGTPIEGYTPSMYLEVFPGLTETDFTSVEASIGHYEMQNERLMYISDPTKLVHSAARAITRPGMATLLSNVCNRLDIDLSKEGTITDVMRYLIEAQ